MKAIHLQTEYLTEPLGLGISSPRFYWNCQGGQRQTAYHIIAKREGQIVWDSGEAESGSMAHVPYKGAPLGSRNHIVWSVRLRDENGEWGEPAGSWFEMGLLNPDDWKAQWITGDYEPKKNMRYPVDCFKKVFRLEKLRMLPDSADSSQKIVEDQKAVENRKAPEDRKMQDGPKVQDMPGNQGTHAALSHARLYITACGLYEAKLNGQRIGDYRLAPGCTDYRKRLQYQVYDVTALLAEENALTVELADGWYRGSVGCYGMTNVFGRRTAFLCQLEIAYADGSRDVIISDGSWGWSNDGPRRFADLKDGEIYDASLTPTYSGRAKPAPAPRGIVLTAADNVAPTEHEHFTAKLIVTKTGKRVLDFGQNMAGFVSFSVKGKKGQQIRLRMGEILDEQGEFTQSNIQVRKPVREVGKLGEVFLVTGMGEKLPGAKQPTPKQEILFTCSGGQDTYKTEFAVFGFRYALIETETDFRPEQFQAIAVYSDLEQTGSFQCSNPKVNQLFSNTLWSMKGNFLDIPTDCPTRERLGWTGDAQIFFDTGAYLMDTAPFFRKWLRDVRDGQTPEGKSSAVVPYNGLSLMYDNTGASVGWADAVVLVPWRFWKRYGDTQVLRDNYETMRRYAMYMIGHTGHKDKKAAQADPYDKYVYEKGFHLGEWLEPEEFQEKIAAGHAALHTEEATAYLHYTMSCMAEIAHELGKKKDEDLFVEYAEGAVKAYDHLFLQNGTIDTDRQAKLVRPLALGLLSGEKKANVQKRLLQAVEKRQYCIGTGFLSTPFVLPVLTDAGFGDAAYRMLENEQAPGWLAEVNAGATTIWEDWEGKVSRNHYSPGAVCQWLFDTVAGIRVTGENRFAIAPVPGGTLTEARAAYRSIYGKAEVYWKRQENGSITYEIIVPANTTARLLLPDGTKEELEPGRHAFTTAEDMG